MTDRYLLPIEIDRHMFDNGGHLRFMARLRQRFIMVTGIDPKVYGFEEAETLPAAQSHVRFAVDADKVEEAKRLFNARGDAAPINQILPQGVPVVIVAVPAAYRRNR